MQDVDYDGWTDYIEEIFQKYKASPVNIADLACGTGNITNRLAQRRYNLIGVDLSEDMLQIAQEKAASIGVEVIYLNQDIRELLLPTELDAILCICDGINYIIDEMDLMEVFRAVYQHLKKDGLFIFDISSQYKLSHVLGQNTFAENYEEVSYIWENYFDENRQICDFDLTIFMKEKDLYRKHEESHSQKAYREDEVLSFVKQIGFKRTDVFDAFSFNKPKKNSERLYFVCQK
ncbi:hypothetical protein Gferi_04190 [Geosporobacter ferrireducens]|uniref:Methyltransferase domain-containing protein n=2 Tax=Geosporobacter ferrireducens TaxID=1424294 RepID=A0A1D8GPY3_9FIRM|nr:hypothetical protein Gferi_04190 [Geosporobacter ferrireducens]MTI56484.1 methyltransferase domain-containing protein [Geosporobacter ferrireducens]